LRLRGRSFEVAIQEFRDTIGKWFAPCPAIKVALIKPGKIGRESGMVKSGELTIMIESRNVLQIDASVVEESLHHDFYIGLAIFHHVVLNEVLIESRAL